MTNDARVSKRIASRCSVCRWLYLFSFLWRDICIYITCKYIDQHVIHLNVKSIDVYRISVSAETRI